MSTLQHKTGHVSSEKCSSFLHGNGETRVPHVAFGFGFRRIMFSFACNIRLISEYQVFFSANCWVVAFQFFFYPAFCLATPGLLRAGKVGPLHVPHILPQIRELVFPVSIFLCFSLFIYCVGEIVGKATSLHCVLLRLLYPLEASVM